LFTTPTGCGSKRHFSQGLVYLHYRGQKLPVHLDTLANISQLVVDISNSCKDTLDMTIQVPDFHEPWSLDKFLCKAYGKAFRHESCIYKAWNYYAVLEYFQCSEAATYDKIMQAKIYNFDRGDGALFLQLFAEIDYKADAMIKTHALCMKKMIGWMMEDSTFTLFVMSHPTALTSLRPDTLVKMMGAVFCVLSNVFDPAAFKKKTLDRTSFADRIQGVGKQIAEGSNLRRSYIPRLYRNTVPLDTTVVFADCWRCNVLLPPTLMNVRLVAEPSTPIAERLSIKTLVFQLDTINNSTQELSGDIYFTGDVYYKVAGATEEDERMQLTFQRANKIGFEDGISRDYDIRLKGSVDIVML